MESVKKYSVNNIGKHIKTLKSLLNEATEREFNKNLTFKGKRFKTLTEEVDSIYLDKKELKAIFDRLREDPRFQDLLKKMNFPD